MSLTATWYAHDRDTVEVRPQPAATAAPAHAAFVSLRFLGKPMPFTPLADFAIQSQSAAAFREIARAASEAADWLDPRESAAVVPLPRFSHSDSCDRYYADDADLTIACTCGATVAQAWLDDLLAERDRLVRESGVIAARVRAEAEAAALDRVGRVLDAAIVGNSRRTMATQQLVERITADVYAALQSPGRDALPVAHADDGGPTS